MDQGEDSKSFEEKIRKGTPLVMAVCTPFRIFTENVSDKWEPTLDQINKGTYDYLKLNRVSGFIDGNVTPYSMLVGFDGTLALPAYPEFAEHSSALKIFNRVLFEMLLGGIYTEAASQDNIFRGWLYDTGYVRIYAGSGEIARRHSALRDRSAGSRENIVLLGAKQVSLSELEDAIKRGRSIVNKCDPLSHEIVLAGCSHYVAGALAESLTCLWTSIEQLLSRIWRVEVEDKASGQGVPKRGEFLKDTRVWTTSARIELLFQIKILGPELYIPLNTARKARNDFVHTGKQPDLETVTEALNALFYLVSSQASKYVDLHLLDEVKDGIIKRCILRPHSAESVPEKEVAYWRAVQPLPGEENFLGKFDQFDLKFVPIESFDPARVKKNALKSSAQPKLKNGK